MPLIMRQLQKLLPFLISESTPLSFREKLRITLAVFVAVLVVGVSSSYFIHGYSLPVLIAAMGASAVLLFATPHSPLAQPWPAFFGPMIAAFIANTYGLLPVFITATAVFMISVPILQFGVKVD